MCKQVTSVYSLSARWPSFQDTRIMHCVSAYRIGCPRKIDSGTVLLRWVQVKRTCRLRLPSHKSRKGITTCLLSAAITFSTAKGVVGRAFGASQGSVSRFAWCCFWVRLFVPKLTLLIEAYFNKGEKCSIHYIIQQCMQLSWICVLHFFNIALRVFERTGLHGHLGGSAIGGVRNIRHKCTYWQPRATKEQTCT